MERRTPDLRGAKIVAAGRPPLGVKEELVIRWGPIAWTIAEPGKQEAARDESKPPRLHQRRITKEHAWRQLERWTECRSHLYGVLMMNRTAAGTIFAGIVKERPDDAYFVLTPPEDANVFEGQMLAIPPVSTAQRIDMTLDLETGDGGLILEYEDCTVTVTNTLEGNRSRRMEGD